MTILGGLASPSILIVSPVIDTVILSDCVHIHGNDNTFFLLFMQPKITSHKLPQGASQSVQRTIKCYSLMVQQPCRLDVMIVNVTEHLTKVCQGSVCQSRGWTFGFSHRPTNQ